jgi:hypothetical protein
MTTGKPEHSGPNCDCNPGEGDVECDAPGCMGIDLGPRSGAPSGPPHWKNLIFDLLDINERQENQKETLDVGWGDPSLPVTHENSPGLHSRLSRELKKLGGDFGPFEFGGWKWTPFVRYVPLEVASVNFGMLDEFASAVERIEANQARFESNVGNTDIGQSAGKTRTKPPSKVAKKATRKR